MSVQTAALQPPREEFLRLLDSHHRWSQPERYPTNAGQAPGVELHATGLDLSRTVFDAMDLAFVWWIDSVLDGSHFIESWMPGARVYGSSWSGCDFTRAQLWKSDAHGCTYTDASFRGADLLRFELWQCDLRRADLSGANLIFFTADESDVRDVTIRDTVLDGVSLHGSHVAGLNLRGCTGTIAGPANRGYPRIDIGTPEEPEWLEGDDSLSWLRSRGAPTLTFYSGPPTP